MIMWNVINLCDLARSFFNGHLIGEGDNSLGAPLERRGLIYRFARCGHVILVSKYLAEDE